MASNSDPHKFINVDDSPPPSPTPSDSKILKEWIGTGQKYRDVPSSVSDELLRRLALPSSALELLPRDEVVIPELIKCDFPSILTQDTSKEAITYFSTRLPTTSELSSCLTRVVPSPACVRKLRDYAGQAMLDGKVSIRDPTRAKSDLFLPFHVLTFWAELTEAIGAKQKWEASYQWLKRMSTMLSNEWLYDSHIDVMLSTMKLQRTQAGGLPLDNVRIETPFVPFLLSRLEVFQADDTSIETYRAKGPEALQELGDHLVKFSKDGEVIFVANSQHDHWSVVAITSDCTIRWGDSLGRAIPQDLLSGIRNWLHFHIPDKTPTLLRKPLPCAKQPDSYSCGIIAINTIKHHLFGEALWTKATREVLRIQEFLAIMDASAEAVRKSGFYNFMELRGAIQPSDTEDAAADTMDFDNDGDFAESPDGADAPAEELGAASRSMIIAESAAAYSSPRSGFFGSRFRLLHRIFDLALFTHPHALSL
ncbi:hypothetical protein BC834DRAFT_846661 [Gloeopeniophorella convolvens]|nr:hypothetical protein BC834DRAFT_846661 [Gloeopeniophorella convolvens]